MLVLVTGATGFLGRRVVRELIEKGDRVRCLVHIPGRERIFSHRDIEVHYGSVHEPDSLSEIFYDVEAVVHLVGTIRPKTRDLFYDVHRDGTANVLAAARKVGARRFLHMSAIGSANDKNYPYFHSKWLGEQEVIGSGIPYTIFRPSILYGEGDEFLNALAGLVRLFPIVPVIGAGNNRMQPLAADDLARCIVKTLDREDLQGRILEFGGPERLNYNQLLSEVAKAMNKRRLKIHIPTWFAYAVAQVAQWLLPRSPITTHQIKMLEVRSVADFREVERLFGFTPRVMEGNISFVNAVGIVDGIQILLGSIPHRIRDH